MCDSYYRPEELADFGNIGEHAPELANKFFAYYGQATSAGKLTKREKALILRSCNLACRHCHVQATPDRPEIMDRATMQACLHAARRPEVTTIDITGGAPELHPDLSWLLGELALLGKRVLVRTNLTVLMRPELAHLPALFRHSRVDLVASLPDYHAARVDRQRGPGTFATSIEVLRRLNALGYGHDGLVLDLVHNPAGAFLPAGQSALETEYRRELRKHGVEFNHLLVLSNFPVGRFLEFLVGSENLTDYMRELRRAFNPATVANVMCRSTVSVAPDGALYDCDFNQVLGLPLEAAGSGTIADFDPAVLTRRRVIAADHCYGCCAGAGSSCQGALADTPA
jgi:radical SAM/Cys-rich protein